MQAMHDSAESPRTLRDASEDFRQAHLNGDVRSHPEHGS
jgi:hypothetical protein